MKKYYPAIRDYALIIISSLIQAVSLQLFFIPADLASGGVSGISQLINSVTGWPIGLMILIGNIPLFLLGWRFLGGSKFAMRTAVAILTYSLLTDLLLQIPIFVEYSKILIEDLKGDIFLNSLYGAIVSGIGYGLVYRARGTSGGSDILARILSNWRGIPTTQSYLIVDTAVILSYRDIVTVILYILFYSAHGTSGASLIFSRISCKLRGVSITLSFIIVYIPVFLFVLVLFLVKRELYAMIALYVSGLVAETVL